MARLDKSRKTTVVGGAFAVKPAKYTDSYDERGAAGVLTIEEQLLGNTVTYTLTHDGRPLISLNRLDAEALGIRLVRVTG